MTIELYNASGRPLLLSGIFLTDDLMQSRK